MFNRFWRGDPSRSRLTGGTGLGLAISLEDARLHNGWLQAWGERGKGAVFRLTLPRKAGRTLTDSPLPLAPADAGPVSADPTGTDPTGTDPTGTDLAGADLAEPRTKSADARSADSRSSGIQSVTLDGQDSEVRS